jgi:hypothetical protein
MFLKKEIKRPEIRVKSRNRLAKSLAELCSTRSICSLTTSLCNEQAVCLLFKFKVVFGCLLSRCAKESIKIIFCIEQVLITIKTKDSIIPIAVLLVL